MKVTKIFTFDCAHRIPNHEGLCRNIHGHTYKAEITFSMDSCAQNHHERQGGPEEGMVMDFSRLKEICKSIIDEHDHAYIAWVEDTEIIEFFKKQGFKLKIYETVPTAENMVARFCHEIAYKLAKMNNQTENKLLHVKLSDVKIWETPTSFASTN